MGTRNLTSVVVDGETKIAQYCQWDGYPTGVGLDIAKFLDSGVDLDGFREKVRALKWLTKEDVAERWKEITKDNDGWATMAESKAFAEKYPGLHRDTGADILELVNEGKVTEVFDDSEFINDTLFCEWAYRIDLDNETVTVLYGHSNRKFQVFSFSEFTEDAMNAFEEKYGQE